VKALLLSNSRNPGGKYLAHCRPAIRAALGAGARHALFVPYAAVRAGFDDYLGSVASALAPAGVTLRGVHRARDPVRAVRQAGAILVGGGNTFHLLAHLYRHELLDAIRDAVRGGTPYMGWSAGANVAGPTIRTTNDMPIVEPPSLDALALVPFQLNPHYTDARLRNHGGETRRDRLEEFCAANPGVPVVGLREGSWLEVADGEAVLRGPKRAWLYVDASRTSLAPGSTIPT
jgi:dipeptidase E